MGITKCSNMVANVLPAEHPPPPPPPPSSTTLGDGFKRSKFNFSEHVHVAYQIYWNHEMKQHGSKYLAGRCPPPPPPPYTRVKTQLFQKKIILHIKLKGITNAATWSQIFYLQTPHPPDPGVGVKDQNSTFAEHGHVANQIQGNHECSNIVANILPADTPPSWGWGQYVKSQLFQNMVMLLIKLQDAATWSQHG